MHALSDRLEMQFGCRLGTHQRLQRMEGLPLGYPVLAAQAAGGNVNGVWQRAGIGFLTCIVACSDYEVRNFKESGPDPDGPAISVDPSVVDLGATCSAQTTEVNVSNLGDLPLMIDEFILTGDGWRIESAPEVPLTLDPEGSEALVLVGEGGPASLSIRSNDPTRSQVTVNLQTDPDVAPTLNLDPAPAGGAIGPGAQVDLTGLVFDGTVDPTSLSIDWVSNVDGALGSTVPTADGTFALPWSGIDRTPGPHQITATFTDACGNTVEDAIVVCQEAGYIADELELDSWHYEGSAFWNPSAEAVELTDLDPFAVGTAFQVASSIPADNLSIRFEFQTGNGTGADGFSVTALDVDRMTGFMGAPGCALGYGEPHESCIDTGEALPGWSIEVDTYYNPYIDPTSSDHLSLTFDGDLDTTAAWTGLPEVEDTGWHTLDIIVRSPNVEILLDDEVLINEDVPSFTPFDAYIGFTAATGADTNEHTIRGLSVSGDACDNFYPL